MANRWFFKEEDLIDPPPGHVSPEGYSWDPVLGRDKNNDTEIKEPALMFTERVVNILRTYAPAYVPVGSAFSNLMRLVYSIAPKEFFAAHVSAAGSVIMKTPAGLNVAGPNASRITLGDTEQANTIRRWIAQNSLQLDALIAAEFEQGSSYPTSRTMSNYNMLYSMSYPMFDSRGFVAPAFPFFYHPSNITTGLGGVTGGMCYQRIASAPYNAGAFNTGVNGASVSRAACFTHISGAIAPYLVQNVQTVTGLKRLELMKYLSAMMNIVGSRYDMSGAVL